MVQARQGMKNMLEKIMLILASASPRRQELLNQIGCADFLVRPAAVDETPRSLELPRAYAQRIAKSKLDKIIAAHPGAWILSADTVVAVGRRILPKAEDAATARKCLELLAGRTHRVYTALGWAHPDGKTQSHLECTHLRFKRLSSAEIERYIATQEWQGKAGGYAIQGRAGAWAQKMRGCYFNVVGLPLTPVYRWLQHAGIMP
jgi:septum formation protein